MSHPHVGLRTEPRDFACKWSHHPRVWWPGCLTTHCLLQHPNPCAWHAISPTCGSLLHVISNDANQAGIAAVFAQGAGLVRGLPRSAPPSAHGAYGQPRIQQGMCITHMMMCLPLRLTPDLCYPARQTGAWDEEEDRLLSLWQVSSS